MLNVTAFCHIAFSCLWNYSFENLKRETLMYTHPYPSSDIYMLTQLSAGLHLQETLPKPSTPSSATLEGQSKHVQQNDIT